MNQFLRKNFAIILAFLLPITLLAVVGLSTYLPGLFISTNYNFLYTTCDDGTYYNSYSCNDYLQKRFSVVDGKIVLNPYENSADTNGDNIPDFAEKYVERIFLHDTEKNETREIPLEEAQGMELNPLLTSPDGVTVSSHYDRNNGDFFFIFGGGSSDYGYYLTKGNSRKQLNLIHADDRYYYRENFHFLGWILPGRN